MYISKTFVKKIEHREKVLNLLHLSDILHVWQFIDDSGLFLRYVFFLASLRAQREVKQINKKHYGNKMLILHSDCMILI